AVKFGASSPSCSAMVVLRDGVGIADIADEPAVGKGQLHGSPASHSSSVRDSLRLGTGAGASLIFAITPSSFCSGIVTRVGMPPPSSNIATKSQPEPNAAAIVSMPESRTIETG